MVFNAISFGNHVSFLTEIVSFPMLMFITIVSFLLESECLPNIAYMMVNLHKPSPHILLYE